MACYYFGEHGLMNIGDLIEANTGETGVVIGVELLYPTHPYSPVRNVEVLWADQQPSHTFRRVNDDISSINVFAVKKVISRGH